MSTVSKPNILSIAGPNSKYRLKGSSPAGFWAGLWHGIIAPLIFLIGLFSNKVKIYEIKNSGRWYDFGFMIGIGAYASKTMSYRR